MKIRKKQPEYDLQVAICKYLELQYPDVLFLSDTIASVKLTMPQAIRNSKIQKNGFKCPDLLILEPKGSFSGLFIELKVESPYKKNGELRKNEHLEAQNKSILKLREKGYYSCFCWDFEMIKSVIDDYMMLENIEV